MIVSRDLTDLLSFQHEAEYKSILSATKSGASEKRLAAQFIPRFFKYFPHLSDQAIDAQTDLCEDSDVSVRTKHFTYVVQTSVADPRFSGGGGA